MTDKPTTPTQDENKSSLDKLIDIMDAELKNRKPQEYDWGYITPENKKKLDDAFKELFDKTQNP